MRRCWGQSREVAGATADALLRRPQVILGAPPGSGAGRDGLGGSGRCSTQTTPGHRVLCKCRLEAGEGLRAEPPQKLSGAGWLSQMVREALFLEPSPSSGSQLAEVAPAGAVLTPFSKGSGPKEALSM